MSPDVSRTVIEPSIAFGDPRHLEASQFLVDEAYVLDAQQYDLWLDMLTDDVRYLMPVRVSTARGAGFDTAPKMGHFDEDRYSLERRVARFATEHAFTEDPPSRLRHHVTNIRCTEGPSADELRVDSAVMLFRSRGDVRPPAFISAGRHDLLRRVHGRWKLAHRLVLVDESVLRTQNLAIFL
ncbi:MAG TPA: 3-phenylpropionate/cinnamic acid dioxygenase subunit beta [Acidimicrobiales bacterium]|nr:3-phenylpropionate/cinnamic acid dioxygenase subunit beta [Acidimicrobiales bacterium]